MSSSNISPLTLLPKGGYTPVRPEPASPITATTTTDIIVPARRPPPAYTLSEIIQIAHCTRTPSRVVVHNNEYYLYWEGDIPNRAFSAESARLLKDFNAHPFWGPYPLVVEKTDSSGIGELRVEVHKGSKGRLTSRSYCCAARLPVWMGRCLSRYEHKELEMERNDDDEAANTTADEDEVMSDNVRRSPHWRDLFTIFDDIIWEGNDQEWPNEIDVAAVRQRLCRGDGSDYEQRCPDGQLEDDALALLDDLFGHCYQRDFSSLRYALEEFDQRS